jgi:hypothetical protein
MSDAKRWDRGERFALHCLGRQAIVPGAAAAARAVFDACGGATDWKSWVLPKGGMIRIALQVLAQFIDDFPDAPAEAAYGHLRTYPGFRGQHVPWAEAPAQVRGAYETFRSIYLQLWVLARAHNDKMARALPPRPLPRLVHSDQRESTMPETNGGAA